ncbi:6866_t:CDS:1, partial [Dentiscutata erythropus]
TDICQPSYPMDDENINITNEFIILDVSKTFNTDKPSWEVNNNGSDTNPKLFNHGITSDGNNSMILFGGITDNTYNSDDSDDSDDSILWYCHTNSILEFQSSNVNKEKISSRCLF